MHLTHLILKNFRNYSSLEFEPDPGLNYLFGPNGAGKTNLLESIHFLVHLRSFRRASRAGMQAEGTGEMFLRGAFARTGGAPESILEAGVRAGERKYQVNGKEETDLLNYLGRVHAVAFYPESLQVVKGGPALRRVFFDRAIAAEEPRHLAEGREYNRLLSERNRLLRGGGDSDIIHVWDRRLLEPASRIVARRFRYMESLRRQLEFLERRLGLEGGPRVRVEYGVGGAGEGDWRDRLGGGKASVVEDPEDVMAEAAAEVLKAAAEAVADQERRRGVTLWGPHLDDFRVLWDHRRARDSASQGEQRLLMIVLVAAAAEGYREARGEEPIFLLDDLSSELDSRRREAVLGYLEGMGAQVFITSTEAPVPRSAIAARSCFHVERGALIPARVG